MATTNKYGNKLAKPHHRLALSRLFYLLVVSILVTLSWSKAAFSHGYVTYPKARQVICDEQGGYWWPNDGSGIANEACRNVFLESGVTPFVQKNELATLVAEPGYEQPSVVREHVIDGLLCAGGDPQKSGLDIPSAHWQRTDLVAGSTIQYRLRATAAHYPNFFEFFVSKSEYNSATDVLSWDDLELFYRIDDVYPTTESSGNYFLIDLPLPAGVSGDAIIYTRWQRKDPAGEGFYNCSDVNFGGETTTGEELTPKAHANAQPKEPVGSEKVTLSASGSTNPNDNLGLSLSYQWRQVEGPQVNIIRFDKEYAQVTLPEVTEETSYRFEVEVSNGNGKDVASVLIVQTPGEDEGEPETGGGGSIEAEYTYPNGLGSYGPGTVVLGTDGSIYECRPFPYSGWCNSWGLYYAPGTGIAWADAWIKPAKP